MNYWLYWQSRRFLERSDLRVPILIVSRALYRVTAAAANRMSEKLIISFVTGNANKLREVESILGQDFPHELRAKDIDLPEYQGDPDTVSRLKCKAAYDIVKGPVVVEDTCLCFDTLGGLPGPYIKWFLSSIGPDGLFKMLKGFDDHGASAMATLAYCDGEGASDSVQLFKGITRGTIIEPRGIGGFGWDSCFLPAGYDITYAEMSTEEKNKISHRKKAVEAMRSHFINRTNNKCDQVIP